MNKVAVLMSVYKNDRLPFVELAVNSVLQQTYQQFDFFIIADGMLDKEVDDFLLKVKDNRIVLYKNKQNKGLAKSLNELLRIVLSKEYEYIARMDADDISLPERIAKQVSFLDKHTDIDCLGTWAIEIDEKGEIFYYKKMPETHQRCYEFFKKRDCLIHPTVMFRRRYFEVAGFYPEDTYFAEDTMMWAKGFVKGCRFANVPDFLFKFRLNKDFFKRRRGWKHAMEIYKLRKKVNRMLQYPISANCYAVLYALAKLMPTSILNIIYKTSR